MLLEFIVLMAAYQADATDRPCVKAAVANVRWIAQEVPHAPLSVDVPDDANRHERKIIVELPVTKTGSRFIPSTIDQVVTLLQRSLPASEKERMAFAFGFSKTNGATIADADELRLGDLSDFYYKHLISGSPKKVSKAFECLSPDGRSFSTLFRLVIDREMRSTEGYTKRSDLPKNYDYAASRILARKIASICGVNLSE